MLVVKRIGSFTSRLFELKAGEKLWIRGPYGRGFERRGERIALVAGGVGAPPLYALARTWWREFERITLIYGTKNKKELAIMSMGNYIDEIVVTTDDGSTGRKGFPTDVLAERKGDYDQVYACGPEPMLKTVLMVMNYENVQSRQSAT